jgi:hypothetical protein
MHMLHHLRGIMMSLLLIPKRLPPSHHPVDPKDNADNRIHHTDIVHVATIDRHIRRETVHHEREGRPQQENPVRKQPNVAHPEGSVGNVVSSLEQQTDDRDSVGDVKKHDASRDHGVEGGR